MKFWGTAFKFWLRPWLSKSVFFTKFVVSLLFAKFASFSLAAKFSDVNLLNSWIAINLSWSWSVILFSIPLIFVLQSVFWTKLLTLAILSSTAVSAAVVAKLVIPAIYLE